MKAQEHRSFSPAAAVLAAVALAVILLFSALPFSLINTGTFCLFVCPFLLCLLWALGGIHPVLLVLGAALWGLFRAAGTAAAVAGAVYLLPLALVLGALLQRNLSFYKAVPLVLGVYVVSVLVLYLWAQSATQGQFFERASKEAVRVLDSLPGRDAYLYLLVRSGLLSADPESITDSALLSAAAPELSPRLIREFYSQLQTRAELWLRSLTPSLLSSYSVYLSLLGTGAALRFSRLGKNSLSSTESPLMPPFTQWHVPRKLPGGLLWALGLGFPLARLSQEGTLYLAGMLMYNVFSAVQSVQGLSLVSALQKRRGVRMVPRMLTAAALFLLFQQVLMFIGLYDQLFDPRRLRAQPSAP